MFDTTRSEEVLEAAADADSVWAGSDVVTTGSDAVAADSDVDVVGGVNVVDVEDVSLDGMSDEVCFVLSAFVVEDLTVDVELSSREVDTGSGTGFGFVLTPAVA